MIEVYHYKVVNDFHAHLHAMMGLRPNVEAVEGEVKANSIRYEHVATVTGDDIWEALTLTNSIECRWYEAGDTRVTNRFEGPGCRSTSAGDVAVDSEGNAWLFTGIDAVPVPTWGIWAPKK